jgi:hypothetical protein
LPVLTSPTARFARFNVADVVSSPLDAPLRRSICRRPPQALKGTPRETLKETSKALKTIKNKRRARETWERRAAVERLNVAANSSTNAGTSGGQASNQLPQPRRVEPFFFERRAAPSGAELIQQRSETRR